MNEQFPLLGAHRGMAALDLATAYLSDMGSHTERSAESARNAILDAGLLVFELSGPGDWEAFDAAEYFRRYAHFPHRERVDAAFTMLGFYGWMAFGELIDMHDARTIVASIMAEAPNEPILVDLCARTLALMGPLPN